ncbi:hypothetical protein IB260_09185 [Pseudomonas sp. PDM23]|uniref:hypothetical protein n=1 Tax=unclassified Pseudomonas TaxID=196821 RepID=UPI001785AB54|nr:MULTISPECIES: hypothetical protein [unclassified Pseudomonas]MBD9575479.1 hypothetical protein [Pseudomonas sp. PDM23]MBD9669579.1 hypothetical protein [Pseudomonas sp. PDM21]
MKRSTLFLLVCAASSFWWLWPTERPHAPQQHSQVLSAGGFRVERYSIYPLQDFSIEARVLGREDYRLGREAELSPTDLALGWGPMDDPQVLADIRISQGNRWFYWHADKLPIPRRELETHAANMHMIPANDDVARALAQVSAGEHVRLSGKLVRVEGDDGWRWVSSLTREDTGAGACELIWLESLERF